MEGVTISRSGYFGAAGHVRFEAVCPVVDVAVIGGGPAGASTAVTLARAGVRVALFERAAKFVPKVGEALPPRVAVVLKSLGVWERFLADDHLRCYGNRSAWGTSRLQEYDFIFDPHGCGWHVDRARFDARLVAAARDAGALWLNDAKVIGWLRSGEGWSLEVRRQGRASKICARFVVDASGRAAVFARAQGAQRRRYDRLVGLAVRLVVADTAEPDTFTLVESVADGWWYSAQLPGRKLVAVFMSDADLLSRCSVRTAIGWLSLLGAARHTCARVEGCVQEGRPVVAAATSSALHRVAGDSWVAVGDAAASYDPLSSQGVVTALEDGQRAGHAVRDWLRGDSGTLAAYADLAGVLYRNYLAQRYSYYYTEQRWTSSPFWHRRVGLSAASPRRVRK
jgi:flavin-dependent dehydrogenase